MPRRQKRFLSLMQTNLSFFHLSLFFVVNITVAVPKDCLKHFLVNKTKPLINIKPHKTNLLLTVLLLAETK